MLSVVGYVLGGLLALVVLLLVIPVFVRLKFYNELTLTVFVFGVPVFRFSSFPTVPKASEEAQPAEEKPKESTVLSRLGEQLKHDGVAAVTHTVGELLRLAKGAFHRCLSVLTVDKLLLRLFVAEKDAATTAQTTGAVCAVLYPTLTALQAVLRVRKREVTVTPDYLATAGKAEMEVLVHTVPFRLLWAVLISYFAYRKWDKHLTIQTIPITKEE